MFKNIIFGRNYMLIFNKIMKINWKIVGKTAMNTQKKEENS